LEAFRKVEVEVERGKMLKVRGWRLEAGREVEVPT
jgi:hypothetical protein